MLEKIKQSYLTKVIIGIFSIWLFGAITISFIETGDFKNVGNSLWWTIVTMTTVGYGDMTPSSAIGRLLAILIMFCGISLIAIVTGTISSIFTTKRIMEGKGLSNINLTNHTLICGWNNNFLQLIKNLIKNNSNINLVLVNNHDIDEINTIISSFKNSSIKFVKGDFSLDSILNKANVTKAKNAIILNDHTTSDEKVILTTLTLKKISPRVKVIAQINDHDKISFLKRANVDAILSSDDFESFMATSHITDPSVANTISNIIDKNSKNTINSTKIPEEFIGKSFQELFNYFYTEKKQICLGLFQEEKNVGISEFLSSDASAIDKFIEEKLEQAGHSLDESNKLNINLNPKSSYIICTGEGALILS